MKIDTRPRHKNASRPADKSARGFLQWIRGRDCVFGCWAACEGKIEAAHLDFAGGKGIGTKVADRFAIPMCSCHHRRQHSEGWDTFIDSMGTSRLELLTIASKLWKAWPGRLAWERKLERANG